MDSNCLICGGPVQQAGPPRCDVCRAIPREQLEDNGFELEVESHLGQHAGTTFHVTGSMTMTSGVAVVLSEEHLGRKVQKLFVDELEIGEATFDRKVFVEYAEPEDLDALRQPWAQTLILEIVKLGQLSVTENHAKVHVHTHTTLPAVEIHALLGMILGVLDRFRVERLG